MIFGIGADIVSIPRIQAMLDKRGDKIAKKILSKTELIGFNKSVKPAAFLAKRFAAKEATAKALGTGFRDGLNLSHISVQNNELGRPGLIFEHRAEKLLSELNVGRSFISLSDEENYAIAYVTLMEKEDDILSDN
jgi:holo-[acyl-carrier protein] synthase|tara:strand:+ start:1731 stop:2135 length:405 start_codon:yes stop_codon:yes gene_type:complete